MKFYQFKGLLQPAGWISPAFVGVDDNGFITSIDTTAPASAGVEFVNGYALPGFRNAHSHAFQFGMAGMAEIHSSGTKDDFWSWREAMYQCALEMDPEKMESIAAMLYSEMLRKGYTHVAEFHYLHHDKNGKPYANLAEMGERLVAAAVTAGIKITLVPIFYQRGGFGKQAQPQQRRFISRSTDEYLNLLDDSAAAAKNYADARLGFGVHSLRAVDAEDIQRTFKEGPGTIPFHLHAAEQLKEVSDCEAFHKRRPIEWLLENLPLNERFHIVHCTHMTDHEVIGLAASKANAVLCPGTEGNLGDGIFRLTDFYNAGGSWSIGTDSHISLNPLEDLRWLDYAQRFTTHKRNTFDDGASILVSKTFVAGRKAMGEPGIQNYFEKGQALDCIVLNAAAPLLSQAPEKHILPAIVYTADSSILMGTMINGRWIVKDQRHIRKAEIDRKFAANFRKNPIK